MSWTSMLSLLASCSMEGQAQKIETKAEVRPPSVAGSFYPGTASSLRATLNEMFARVPDIVPEGEILAAVAPHAGYVYSGEVAAYTHKALSAVSFDTAVIIGHDAYRGAVAHLNPVDAYETPLGRVPVDQEMQQKMMAFHPGIVANKPMHAREHTIEVQLPFLQAGGRDFKIVPVLFGNPTESNAKILADAIRAAAGGKKIFILASTDMSHYPPYAAAQKVDRSSLDSVRLFDVGKLMTQLERQEHTGQVPNLQTVMCARGGVATALLYAGAQGANHVQVLHYANSGDVPIGNKDGVVGYFSALIVKKPSGE